MRKLDGPIPQNRRGNEVRRCGALGPEPHLPADKTQSLCWISDAVVRAK
jgi:hypothetical protein